MKKYISKAIFGGLIFCVGAQAAHAYQNHDTAVVRVMDKAAGKVQGLSLPVGQTVRFEKLSLTVRACKQTDPFQAENFWAFTEISDADDGLIFSNWLSRNEPGDNPLQNPDYDVWLVRCESSQELTGEAQ